MAGMKQSAGDSLFALVRRDGTLFELQNQLNLEQIRTLVAGAAALSISPPSVILVRWQNNK